LSFNTANIAECTSDETENCSSVHPVQWD